MADPITREEWHQLQQTIRDGFGGINARLDVQNGRLGAAERQVAVLTDRSNDARMVRWIDRGVAALVAGGLAWWRH